MTTAEQQVTESFETLRQILSRQQKRDVSLEEASEIGYGLIAFYKALAGAD